MTPAKVLVINASDHDNHDNLGPIKHILSNPAITNSTNLSTQWTSYQNGKTRYELFGPDLLIISGRNYSDQPATMEDANKWYGWINELSVPVFTICGSYQRWIMSLGGQIRSGNPENGLIQTYLRDHHDDPLHHPYPHSRTYIHNHHRYFVDDTQLPDCVFLLGHTLGGASIIKHKSKPIYGFQGHPEQTFSLCSSPSEILAKQFSQIIFNQLFKLARLKST